MPFFEAVRFALPNQLDPARQRRPVARTPKPYVGWSSLGELLAYALRRIKAGHRPGTCGSAAVPACRTNEATDSATQAQPRGRPRWPARSCGRCCPTRLRRCCPTRLPRRHVRNARSLARWCRFVHVGAGPMPCGLQRLGSGPTKPLVHRRRRHMSSATMARTDLAARSLAINPRVVQLRITRNTACADATGALRSACHASIRTLVIRRPWRVTRPRAWVSTGAAERR